jgi:hypothetical protein
VALPELLRDRVALPELLRVWLGVLVRLGVKEGLALLLLL